jgi:hypothetical protein
MSAGYGGAGRSGHRVTPGGGGVPSKEEQRQAYEEMITQEQRQRLSDAELRQRYHQELSQTPEPTTRFSPKEKIPAPSESQEMPTEGPPRVTDPLNLSDFKRNQRQTRLDALSEKMQQEGLTAKEQQQFNRDRIALLKERHREVQATPITYNLTEVHQPSARLLHQKLAEMQTDKMDMDDAYQEATSHGTHPIHDGTPEQRRAYGQAQADFKQKQRDMWRTFEATSEPTVEHKPTKSYVLKQDRTDVSQPQFAKPRQVSSSGKPKSILDEPSVQVKQTLGYRQPRAGWTSDPATWRPDTSKRMASDARANAKQRQRDYERKRQTLKDQLSKLEREVKRRK